MKYLYVFGPLEANWKSWFFYGTEKKCRKWLLEQYVEEQDLDDWIKKAHKFTKVQNVH